jgi:3D-(3,5/4)-trihydroxycyclohexane-1,2-dione acylhydrolase (decyclizing)
VLLLPGDTFASRRPDPVLQQVEDFDDPTVTANDCLRPVSRYWDRIARPAQLLASLPRALEVLTDPARCGPVTLALPQDVQAEAWAYPEDFFTQRLHRLVRPLPQDDALEAVAGLLSGAQRPLIIAGGGVKYSLACETLARFAEQRRVPVAETQAGKGALPWDHPANMGGIGVTGSSAANRLAEEADLVLAVGTRLTDFTTASRTLFRNPALRLVGLNVAPFDAAKHGALPLPGDARATLEALGERLGGWQAPRAWHDAAGRHAAAWQREVDAATAPQAQGPASDAQVLGAVNRQAGADGVVVCAAGGLPGELHKLWRARDPQGYHLEYGYSCMGYEIAGGLGVKLALPGREVFVLVGDGSYLMLNSEIATSVMLERKLVIVVLDNRGFGCIGRLQRACGGEPFNNRLADAGAPVEIDFAAHAAALGAQAERVADLATLEAALQRARQASRTAVIVIETDPWESTGAGGAWWDVPVAEVSRSEAVRGARARYEQALPTAKAGARP